MRITPLVYLLLSLALLGMMASCSSSGITTAGPLTADTTSEAVDTAQAPGSFPTIPLDEDAPRGVSNEGPPPERIVVAGADFLQQWSGEVVDRGLQLDPTLEGGRHAWGLYKVGGLSGKRPLAMNVEALPGTPRQEYFVALANYTRGTWDWFGPSSLPELQIDLRDKRGRYINGAGNMYFLVAAHGANSALHSQTTVAVGALRGDEEPGCPVALRASDGDYADVIHVEWRAGEGATRFELFRAHERDGDRPDWRSLAFTTDTSYRDAEVEPGKPYIYKVRAVNEAGRSCFSNVDRGHAGEFNGPGGFGGSIGGRVVKAGTDEGLGGIFVGVLGIPGHHVASRPTNAGGFFEFPNLPAGKYIVFVQAPQLSFEPRFMLIHLNPENRDPRLRFEAHQQFYANELWGFAYLMGGPDAPGLHPLGDAQVTISGPNGNFTVQTGPAGFWSKREVPNGPYNVTISKDGLNFMPQQHNAHVSGQHATPALVFLGVPPPPQ